MRHLPGRISLPPPSVNPTKRSLWKEYLQPKEHGSWSLASEPVALGLLVAPSRGGLCFAIAVVAGFFGRRPLRIVARDPDASRRKTAARLLVAMAVIVSAAVSLAVAAASTVWLVWLLPAVLGGGVFAWYDARASGRKLIAELSGTAAFASLPAVFAAIAHRPASEAIALGVLMASRAIPTVLLIRAAVRRRKTGDAHFVGALLTATTAVVATSFFAVRAHLPLVWVALVGLLLLRAFVVRLIPAPSAKALGISEAMLGIALVISGAAA
jgi:hypothetical protein